MARTIRKTEVVNVVDISPNIRRITLGGTSLTDFPVNQESGYVKLMFPQEGEDSFSDSVVSGLIRGDKPRFRSYTVLDYDDDTSELTIDFLLHADKGPASTWASKTHIGDTISIRGPGGTKLVNPSADWYLLAGDLAALPALSVNIKKLSKDAKGYACIEIIHEEDKLKLDTPPGIEVIWVTNPQPTMPNTLLVDAIKQLPWLAGDAEVWFAGEFSAMRAARKYLKQERNVSKGNLYASSYWKIGATDEGNKKAKMIDNGILGLGLA
jgi:NADPH-dependent ferric siderophore reductase